MVVVVEVEVGFSVGELKKGWSSTAKWTDVHCMWSRKRLSCFDKLFHVSLPCFASWHHLLSLYSWVTTTHAVAVAVAVSLHALDQACTLVAFWWFRAKRKSETLFASERARELTVLRSVFEGVSWSLITCFLGTKQKKQRSHKK